MISSCPGTRPRPSLTAISARLSRRPSNDWLLFMGSHQLEGMARSGRDLSWLENGLCPGKGLRSAPAPLALAEAAQPARDALAPLSKADWFWRRFLALARAPT